MQCRVDELRSRVRRVVHTAIVMELGLGLGVRLRVRALSQSGDITGAVRTTVINDTMGCRGYDRVTGGGTGVRIRVWLRAICTA